MPYFALFINRELCYSLRRDFGKHGCDVETVRKVYQSIMPYPVRHILAQTRGFLRHRLRNRVVDAYLKWRWERHPAAQASMARLRALRDTHRGERCFIMGNGPSLAQMDLTPLANEVTFGLNRIYLLFPEIDFRPTYYVSINRLVIEQFADEIAALQMPKFIAWRALRHLPHRDDITFLRTVRGHFEFSRDVSQIVYEGSTVTFVAMQLAYAMGFTTVNLIGVDHNFATEGRGSQTVIAQQSDPNHFHPDYFSKGTRWQLPDLDGSERAYAQARRVFEADGRVIQDATVNGKLQIFPKVDYNSLF